MYLYLLLCIKGGILLTASHNPGGPDNDFGIKFNTSNGGIFCIAFILFLLTWTQLGPAPEGVTNKIYEYTTTISEYHVAEIPDVDLSVIGSTTFGDFSVEIIDSVEDYVQLMKEIFSFDTIKQYFQNSSSTLLFDGMHGVTGSYAKRIFLQELGLPENSVMNCVPLEDFGGGHPDPNLTYAHELVERVRSQKITFGAASDGDGDRNMIIGHDAFVNPSDSVAIIAAHASHIPYFKKTGIRGLARSMPTSTALDNVAKKLNYQSYEVPTGWKFFGNLMDAGQCSICGEESFGTGSDHIREKDGIWAILAWLNILAEESKKDSNASLGSILNNHYAIYGRNYFSRYDYEEVDSDKASAMMKALESSIDDGSLINKTIGSFTIDKADNFSYTDPIDKSVSKNQGLRIIFKCGSRVIYRLSGTGSQGATIRMYVEKYEADAEKAKEEAQSALKPLIDSALELSKLEAFTGRKEPTVIT